MSIKAFALTAAAISAAVCASPAQAQSDYTDVAYNTFWSGTLQFTQTADAESALEVVGITYAATPGGGSVQTGTYNPATATGQTTWLQLLTGSTYPSSPTETVTAANASITYSRKGQSVTVKNFELNTQQGTVYADIYSSEGSFMHQSWLVAGDLSGTTGDPGNIVGGHAAGGYTNLVLDGYNPFRDATGALGIFNRGLGLSGPTVNWLGGVSFANVSYSADYLIGFYWPWELPPKASLVPEPSTYALMAAGFACLSMVVRRRKPRAA